VEPADEDAADAPPDAALGPRESPERAAGTSDSMGKGLAGSAAWIAADRARWAELVGPTARLAEQFQRQFARNDALMKSIYDSSRMLDRVIPDLVKPFELAAASQLTKLVSGESPLFTARVALDAQFDWPRPSDAFSCRRLRSPP
jgi:hypothetical protein